jgi:DNA replication protein DnaC
MKNTEPKTEFPKSLEQMQEEEKRYKDRHSNKMLATCKIINQQQNPADSLSMIMQRAGNLTVRPQKIIDQAMDYHDARKVFWVIMTNIAATRHCNAQVDDCNKAVIASLVKYMIADPKCSLDLTKGIFLFGAVGVGKTFLMQSMQAFAEAANINSRKFRIASTSEMADMVRYNNGIEPMGAPLQRYYSNNWCFDDIGQEPISVMVYGDTRHIMEPVMTRRYTNATVGHCTTHATSNLSPEELEAYYGTRISDRFNEMFNFVFLDGKSRRA